MKYMPKWLFVWLTAIAIAIPTTSFATNGMFLIGYGTKARGAGGVAIAMPQDAIAGAVNPATISFVESRVDVGADIFVPTAEAELGGLRQESRANLFAMPAMGGVYGFNRKISMGFSAVPYGGGGSRYNTNLYNASSGSNPDCDTGREPDGHADESDRFLQNQQAEQRWRIAGIRRPDLPRLRSGVL